LLRPITDFDQFDRDRDTEISQVFRSAVLDWRRRLDEHRDALEQAGFGELALIATRQPTTKGQLVEFIERALGYCFSRGQIVCSTDPLTDQNCVPIDWLWEIYCLANGRSDDGAWRELTEGEVSEEQKEYLLKGPRGGSKTESIAALWYTICWFCPNYSVTHSSTERAQSTTCLEYVIEWAASRLFSGLVEKANTQVGVKFKNHSRFVIRTGTLDGLNHEHTISLSLDEVETFPLELIGQAAQIPQRQVGSPYPSIFLLASTQKKANMNMAHHIKEAILNGKYRYLVWNAWDVGQRCPDRRREKLPPRITCKDYPLIMEEIGALEAVERTEDDEEWLATLYEYRDTLVANCALVIDCHGRLVQGTGHLHIDTLLSRIKTLDRDTWVAENLCTSPARGNAVYTRLSSEGNQSFAAVYQGEGQLTYAGVDYGLVGALSVVVIFAINGAYVDVIDEYATSNAFEEDLIPVFVDFQRRYGVKAWGVDNQAVNLVRRMRRKGLNAQRASKTPKLHKIDHVAQMICNGVGFRRLRFHPTKAYTTFEQMFHYALKKNGRDPVDGDDDYCDAALYGLELVRTKVSSNLQRRRSYRPGTSLVDYYMSRR
jgi:hypothetical protein